ncbi:MAG: NAD-dependent epimerase/dehydratase family protein [Nitrososphaeria archaeon]
MILLTGGSGFIGTNVQRYAAEHKIDLTVCSRNPQSQFRFRTVSCDLAQIDENFLYEYDHVIHLASYRLQESSINPFESTSVNIMGFLNLLNASLKAGVKRVVWLSSSAVYGHQHGILDESSPVRPEGLYAAGKLYDEMLSEIYSRLGLSVIILRVPAVFGPYRRYEAMSYNDDIFKNAKCHKKVELTDGEYNLNVSWIFQGPCFHIISGIVY